jgi:hypothetical protein
MTSFRMTEHAQRRVQQRGISALQIELITTFGDDHYQKGGCHLSFLSEKRLAQLRQAIDKLSGIALIKGEAECVVTAMRMDRRIRHT